MTYFYSYIDTKMPILTSCDHRDLFITGHCISVLILLRVIWYRLPSISYCFAKKLILAHFSMTMQSEGHPLS